MKVVMIHDTPSYDNTATHEISYKSMTKDKKKLQSGYENSPTINYLTLISKVKVI